MADLGKCWDSFQTPWISSYMLENAFPTTFDNVGEDYGWIPKGPKSADFDQNAWAIAHGFENGGFGSVLGFVPNSLNFFLYACKCISKYFRESWWRFRANSEGSEIGRFWPKSLGYSPWFWKWWIWVSVGIRSKLPESPPTFLQMHFQLLSTMLVQSSGEFRRVRNRPILTKKPGL